MKVKKELRVKANKVEIGDEIKHFGVVVATNENPNDGHAEFAYIDNETGNLGLDDWPADFDLYIYREVEKPDSVDVRTKYGDTLRVGDDYKDDVWIDVFVEGESRLGGRVVDANELINAIKAVKGNNDPYIRKDDYDSHAATELNDDLDYSFAEIANLIEADEEL